MSANDTIPVLEDAQQIERFVRSAFRYAGSGGTVSLRCFFDDAEGVESIRDVKINGSLDPVVRQAIQIAGRAARAPRPVVFAPPVATFDGNGAAEGNLREGLALSVECDVCPQDARRRLTGLLGPPTFVVASGGRWTNTDTGEVEDKLHLHWRLREPTRTPEEHQKLKLLRSLACDLVGADASSKSIVHPLRCPGSVHRKAHPRLAMIVSETDNEIDLDATLDELQGIVAIRDSAAPKPLRHREPGEEILDPTTLASAAERIPNADDAWDEWNKTGMAFFRASDGSEDGFKAFDTYSRTSKKKYDANTTRARWENYRKSPPSRIGPGTIIFKARQADPLFLKPRLDTPLDGVVPDEADARAVDSEDGPHPGDPPTLGMRDPTTGRLILSPKRTLPTAEAFVREFHQHSEGRTLHFHAGRFLEWRDNRFCEVEDGALNHRLQPWLHDALRYEAQGKEKQPKLVKFESNPTTVKHALESIRAYTFLPGRVTSPSWLDDNLRPPATEILVGKTSNLHISTGHVLQPTPALFTMNALDFDFDPSAREPDLWLKFIYEVFGTDRESIELLQDWFGYSLTPDTSQQKILLIVGPPRSGKGTIGQILTALLGTTNVVNPTTASLAGPFGLQSLIDKSLALVSDARFKGDSVPTVVERLLCISGEDALTIDRKYLPPVTTKLPTRFVLLTNEFPRFSDASGALAQRFLLLRLTKSFLGQEELRLADKLRTELPGILLWAIDGWRRLQERGHFFQPKSAEDGILAIKDLASPVGAFVRDRCTIGPGHRVSVEKLYDAWRSWCGRDGRTVISNVQTFGRDLAAAVPGITRRRGTGDVPFYEGITSTRRWDDT